MEETLKVKCLVENKELREILQRILDNKNTPLRLDDREPSDDGVQMVFPFMDA